MASSEVDIHGQRVRVRDVGLVVLFTVITLGIYNMVWYYRINRELRDFGRVYRDPKLSDCNPTLALLAVTLGGLVIVPAIVSYYRTTGRIRQAQRIVHTDLTNGWVIFACYLGGLVLFLPALAIPGYVQSGLNRVWTMFPRIDPEAQALAPPLVPPGSVPDMPPPSGAPTTQPPPTEPPN